MALLDTYKSMREYVIKYLSLKAGFYCEVSIFKRFNRIEMRVGSESDMSFKHLVWRLKELKIDFAIEPAWGWEREYIVLTEDEYLKLYTLCSLQNKF
jgi:hypothetical protein